MTTLEKIQKFIDLMNEAYPNEYQEFAYTTGRKYYKIITKYKDGSSGGSSYAFVDFDGNMYKAASWAAPAKGIRDTLDNVLSNPISNISPYGFGYR